MQFLWRDFERNVRRLHRAETEKSPELRNEFKRQRKAQSAVIARVSRRLVLPLFWNCIFLSMATKINNLPLAAAVISLWAAGTALGWGHRWFQQFYASEELVVLNHLPLDDQQIFRFQMRRYLGSAMWICWELLLAYLVLGFVGGTASPPLYALPLAAMLQALLVIALAIHAVSFLHMLPLGMVGGLFRLTAVLLLMLGTQGIEASRYIVQGSEWFLPTGWLNFILLRAGKDPTTFALLIPIAALIYLSKHSFGRLRNFYSLEGVEILPSSGAGSGDQEELTDASFGQRRGPTEIEDRINARYFLESVNWQAAGPVEKLVGRMLNNRDRVITEFLVAQDPGWTRSLKWSFWMWLIVCTLVWALGHFGGTIVFFAAYVLAAASLPLFGGDWRGMRQTASGGMFLPGYSLYPITFNAIARIFLKVNLLRIAAASPFIVSFGALAAFKLNDSPVAGALIAAKLLGILVVVQPLFVLLPISSTTNDTSRMRLLWVLLFVPLFVVMIGSAIGVFLSNHFFPVLGSYLLLLLLSSGIFVLYRRAYRAGKFDLLSQRIHQQIS
jgi:hypothetical protein